MIYRVATLIVAFWGSAAAWTSADPVSADGNVAPDTRVPYFALESSIPVGNKGEEALDVSVEAQCGRSAWLFDHAELVVTRNRFGDVQFVGLPQPGCAECAPVRLRWFHEPTGYLSFEVNVYRRLEVIQCPADQLQQDHG